jgi:hypothetical protein
MRLKKLMLQKTRLLTCAAVEAVDNFAQNFVFQKIECVFAIAFSAQYTFILQNSEMM